MVVLRYLRSRICGLFSFFSGNSFASVGLIAAFATGTIGTGLQFIPVSSPSGHVPVEAAPTPLSISFAAIRHSVPVSVTVHHGDTLSSISQSVCGTAGDWSGLFAANRPPLVNPDVIEAGQVLRVRCYDPGYTPPAPPPAPVHAPVQQNVQPAVQPPVRTVSAPAATYTGSSSMQQCIIRAESGGNSQVWNPTGHYGLYQFSAATWAAHGGNPADFGHASVAEQNQVYANTVAQDGYSDWAPYDGC